MAARSTQKPRVPKPSGPAPTPTAPTNWKPWLGLFAALLLVTLAVYQPAWHGAPLWDDDGHLTRPELQSLDGLRRIWTEVTATQQYYPLVHSAFWLMHQLWGDATLGYHLVNICLHALSALLLAMMMRRLALPGAWLAAFLFALHPVQVESVAWMTELKNTLSTPLYLSAALAYLRFDDSRRRRHWVLAAGLFVLALLSKTVTATLPISLLVLAWWRRGELTWSRDVRPMIPFFAFAIVAGVTTAWVEHTIIGAKGAEFELSPVERVLLAGRAVWFYASSIVWPAGLVFQYPRWTVSATSWWQYLFPAGLMAVMFALWRLRDRTRGPLATLLLFGAALSPALGFINVYPFRYSFVADHFQYTASLALIGSLAAFLTRAMAERIASSATRAAAGAVLVAPLAVLSWQHSHQYVDNETLYLTTIERNPRAFMAHHNLAVLRIHGTPPNLTDGLRHVEESIRIEPNNAEALNTRGFIRQQTGQFDAARQDFDASIRLSPGFASAHNNLGVLHYSLGRIEDAMASYREAIRLNPRDSEALRNLGIALMDTGRLAEAGDYIRRAHALNPASPEVVSNLATITLREGNTAEAVTWFERAIAMRPNFPAARNNLGIALEALRRLPEAEVQYREVLRLEPESTRAQDNLGFVLLQQGKFPEALTHFGNVIGTRPDAAQAAAGLAAALQGLGRRQESIDAYRRALLMPANANSADVHNDYGVTLAEGGRLAEAIAQFQEALRLNPDHRDARANLARARK